MLLRLSGSRWLKGTKMIGNSPVVGKKTRTSNSCKVIPLCIGPRQRKSACFSQFWAEVVIFSVWCHRWKKPAEIDGCNKRLTQGDVLLWGFWAGVQHHCRIFWSQHYKVIHVCFSFTYLLIYPQLENYFGNRNQSINFIMRNNNLKCDSQCHTQSVGNFSAHF